MSVSLKLSYSLPWVFGDRTLLWCLFKCSHSLGKFRAPSYVCLLCATQTAIPCGVVEDSCSYSWCSCCCHCRCFPLLLLEPLVECNLVFNLIAQLQIEFQFPLLNLCRQAKKPPRNLKQPKESNASHQSIPWYSAIPSQILLWNGMATDNDNNNEALFFDAMRCDSIRGVFCYLQFICLWVVFVVIVWLQ